MKSIAEACFRNTYVVFRKGVPKVITTVTRAAGSEREHALKYLPRARELEDDLAGFVAKCLEGL